MESLFHLIEHDYQDSHPLELMLWQLARGNTYNMLNETRFSDYFEFHGTWDTHYGIFEGCGGNMPFSSVASDEASCC